MNAPQRYAWYTLEDYGRVKVWKGPSAMDPFVHFTVGATHDAPSYEIPIDEFNEKKL